MSFFDRQFDVYLFLGDPLTKPLWHWSKWIETKSVLDPIIKNARGPASVRCDQHESSFKPLKFGRLSWNEPSFAKWVHGSPTHVSASHTWIFSNMEAWAPSWTQCEKENKAPDVYFTVQNEAMKFPQQNPKLAFNPVAVLALAADIKHPNVDRVLKQLNAATKPVLIAHAKRPWGVQSHPISGAYSDCIQDAQFFRWVTANDEHRRPVNLSTLKGQWRQFKL